MWYRDKVFKASVIVGGRGVVGADSVFKASIMMGI